jgi:glutamine amidotransferase
MRIVIVDYGLGNLFSVAAALKELGHAFVIDTDGSLIAHAEIILVPGVAAFGAGLDRLRSTNQAAALSRDWKQGKRLIGLCLGAQMFLATSDEDPGHEGLGFVAGHVQALDRQLGRVPNQGWLKVDFSGSLQAQPAIEKDPDYFYFSHSYKFQISEPSAENGIAYSGHERIVAAYEYENVTGIQFHPERSGPAGLRLLARLLGRPQ